jgi:hypothetical protein
MKILGETGQSNYTGDYVPKAKIPESMKDGKTFFPHVYYEDDGEQETKK